jgi:hypothetical protein
MDIKPSDEQIKIIELIQNNNNVVVDSVAGAGKTTTLIFIAQHNPDKNILQITYNKQLKLEVRNKMKKCELNNIEIHTYHSLAVKYYDPMCYTDDNIIGVLDNDKPIKNFSKYDIIVIDEVQDMTPNYYELIYKFMNDINFTSNILVLGDIYQGIYEFKNADVRFLSLSRKIWNKNKFIEMTLNQSYRVTKQIAWFVNNVMLGYNRIISHKESIHKIYYYKKNIHNIHNALFNKIKSFFNMGYKPEDIFILSPSLKSAKNPIKKLENIFVKNNYPVYFSRNDEEGIDEKIIAGKIVFTSFHQSKGRERKIVLVFGFDDTYFDFFAKEKSKMSCPSELYVAITRSSEILIIIDHIHNPSLSFLKMTNDDLKNNINIEYISEELKTKKKQKNDDHINITNIHNTTINDLTSYLSESTLRVITPLINMIFEINKSPTIETTIDMPLNVTMKNGLVEDVSDLNGLIIPAIYEARYSKNNKSTIQKIVEQYCSTMNKENKFYIEKKKEELIKYQNDPISIYLILGNLYIALTENILSKLNQINCYDWLSKDIIKICHKNIKNNIQKNAEYEKYLYNNKGKKNFIFKHSKYKDICIVGKIDAYDDIGLWKIKCVNNLNTEHMLQLIFYAWMWEQYMKAEIGFKKYKLLNIRTGEVKELIYNEYLVKEIIELVFINKYEAKIKDSDLLFLEKCKKIRRKYEK